MKGLGKGCLVPGAMIALGVGLLGCKRTPVSSHPKEEVLQKEELPEAERDLKALHAAMTKYLSANGDVWPQPSMDPNGNREAFWKFWMTALEPHGATVEDWRCEETRSTESADYLPSHFSSEKGEARKWERQPWFVQIAGENPSIVYPNGEVIEFEKPMPQAADKRN